MSAGLARLAGRLRLTVGRAVLALVNDAAKLQAVQVQLQEGVVRDRAEHFQHYGFTSHPLPGAEGIALSVAASSDHTVVINIDDRRYRLKGLVGGEVALYTDEGDKIHFKRGNVIQIVAATKLQIDAPDVEISGNIAVGGAVVAQGNVTGLGVSLKTHTHGGVQSGPSSTAAPN